jgi:hypothetical protein
MKHKMIIFFLCCHPLLSNAHGGGLDSQGGHTNRKTGEYHCHREPCFSHQQQKYQKTASLNHPENELIKIQEKENISLPVYDREDWNHWIDIDGDCQDTRAELLIAKSLEEVTFTNTNECTISTGEWVDPYTTQIFTLASEVDIDHIVPLHWAHEHGGAYWSKDKKEEFANDIQNLLIVDKGANRSKGSQGINDWLPPNKDYHCIYVEKWLAITDKYALHYSTKETIDLAPIIQPCDVKNLLPR